MFASSELSTASILNSAETKKIAVTVVIPAHNEELILEGLLNHLTRTLLSANSDVELLICENGSTDRTSDIARLFVANFENVRLLHSSVAAYGNTIALGIKEAQGEHVVVINADLWDADFYDRSLELLADGTDLVVGSKCLQQESDQRPLLRKLITMIFNQLLKVAFGFKGSDTHGLKALKRSRLLPLVNKCQTLREVFDTELVLRAQFAGCVMAEIPVTVVDLRPARLSLLRRIIPTIVDLARIFISVRAGENK